MTYKQYRNPSGQLVDGIARANDDGSISYIRNDASNKDWQSFQEWLAGGGTAASADPAMTAAEILTADRAAAVDTFLNNAIAKVDRAAALVTMDRVNAIHAWLMAFKAATAAATSFANLQTRIAALDAMPQFQASDIKGAIQTKITGGLAD